MEIMAELDPNNQARFRCPFCNREWVRDLSLVESASPEKSIRCRCSCKKNFCLLPDRRKHFRKKVTLSGAYIHERIQTRGLIHFKDISRSGARFEINAPRSMNIGDPILLRFSLDDLDRSVVEKESVIRKIDGQTVSVEFSAASQEDEALARYIADTE
jgi:hypothetical protein